MVPVRVDYGEIAITPDDRVVEVVGGKGKTDAITTELPEGTKIFSKDNGFADEVRAHANILSRVSKSKNKGTIDAEELNKNNARMKIEEIAMKQDVYNYSKGGTVKGYAKGTRSLKKDPLYDAAMLEPLPFIGIDTAGYELRDNAMVNTYMNDRLAGDNRYKPGATVERRSLLSGLSRTLADANWGKITNGFTDVATVANLMSSTRNGTPEVEQPQVNPYADSALSVLKNRSFRTAPAIRGANESYQIAQYNAGQGQSGNLAYKASIADGRNKAISDIYAQASNVNNEYAGQYAQSALNVGEQDRNNAMNTNLMNAQNRAAVRNTQRQGRNDLNSFFQIKQKSFNQANRDRMMLGLMDPMFKEAFTTDVYNNLQKQINR
jgi:hypothetical protein